MVKTLNKAEKISLIGFKCDEGVRRNNGRVGTYEGPDYIRKYLSKANHIVDLGDVICQETDFTPAHKCLQKKVFNELEKGSFPFVMGGGHDMSFSNFVAAARYIQKHDSKSIIGAINIDPHLDIRDFDKGANSGTSFKEIAKYCEKNKLEYNYYCIGVNRDSNSDDLFETAKKLGVHYSYDNELEKTHALIKKCVSKCDYIYLTLDMDVFKSEIAPGVSAVAKVGWEEDFVKSIIQEIKSSNKIIVADIAELNPRFDIDDRTAKLAAKFTELILA